MNFTADRDEPGKLTSGVLAVVVHIAFFAMLVLGVSWQHRAPDTVEVELWNNLPPVPQVKPPPQPKPEPKVEVKPPPPPPPPPQPKAEVKPEPKPAPETKPEPKPDIALEREKQEKARREREAQEKAEALKREQIAKAEAKKREDARKREEAEKQKLAALERERRQQQEVIEKAKRDQEEAIERLRKQAASQQAKVVDEYKRRISDKIRRYVVKDPCAPLGNPEIVFEAVLLPDGNTLQPPRIKRSSGSAACDDAVLRAVIRAQPLPLPPDPVLMAQFRELNLEFRPIE